MVLGFLKGEKVDIGIQIDRPGKPYYPGDVIHATISLRSTSKVKVREVFAGLVLWERYQYGTTDSEGDRTTSWATSEDFVIRETLAGEGEIPAGFSETYHLDLLVPMNAAPPFSGKIVQSRWLVKVVADRRLKKDVREEVEIPIIVPPPPNDATFGRGFYPPGGRRSTTHSISTTYVIENAVWARRSPGRRRKAWRWPSRMPFCQRSFRSRPH